MIKNVLDALILNEYYGAGECTEIAKGKNEIVTNFAGFKRKIKRAWLKK